MNKKISMLVCSVLALCLSLGTLSGCNKQKISNETTAFVVMSEEVDGVFNPFFYTSGPDGEVVGLTQLSMLSSDNEGKVAVGKDEPSVVLDYAVNYDENEEGDPGKEAAGKKGVTTYTFVLKNGIKFTNGEPLTVRDVLFNMYVYLDPVYTGSSTMYSTDIMGLAAYRTQNNNGDETALDTNAATVATNRRDDMTDWVDDLLDGKYKNGACSYESFLADLESAHNETLSGYPITKQVYDDITTLIDKFKEELETDWRNNKDGYLESGAAWKEDEVHSFMYAEGLYTWDKKNEKIESWDYPEETVKTKEQALKFVLEDNIPNNFAVVAHYFASGSELFNEFVAAAKEDLLKGDRKYYSIEGVKVLDGKTTSTVTIKGDTEDASAQPRTYNVAVLPTETVNESTKAVTQTATGDCDSKWAVTAADKYQVLQIKINGVDPKAIWNFGFTVAPMSYYSTSALVSQFYIPASQNPMEYAAYGLEYSTLDFMEKTLKGGDKIGVPVGAGPYKATDRNNSANPSRGNFNSNNIIYFTRNDDFLLGKPKIKLVRYQVINASQSINVVKNGSIHYAMPQATTANMETINKDTKNLAYIRAQQLGYGYIGINAGKITNRHLRHAIMVACDTSLCKQFYTGNLASTLAWPMSKVSWAYPDASKDGDREYAYAGLPFGENKPDTLKKAQDEVIKHMQLANCSMGNPSDLTPDRDGLIQYPDARTKEGKALKYTFTIAGSDLSEHPAYLTLFYAAKILNACGWDVRVEPDSYALSKLASGKLTVWAAAWSTSLDPDMYQVYHKNSKATSTLNWGYDVMKSGATEGTLEEDWKTVDALSKIIDNARKTNDQDERTAMYEDALKIIIELGVELPTYQRSNIYLYNKKIVDGSTLNNTDSAFTSPISRIWEVSLLESK
ncbi:MAG: hypothetical protein K2M95_02895 [Clostridiales bacterium]|nr:hypothetical protein [Clostridiales bacterium]